MKGPEIDLQERAALVERRVEAVRRAMRDGGAGGALLATRRDTAWLTLGAELHVVAGSEDAAIPVLVTPDDAIAVSPNNEADRVRDEELGGLPLRVEVAPWHDSGAGVGSAMRLAEAMGVGDRLLPGDLLEEAMEPLRSRLEAVEHERMRWLGARTAAALDATSGGVGAGITELDVMATLASSLLREGIRSPVLLAGADDRLVRYPHPLPSDHSIASRVLITVVAERWGLHVAGTRIANLREPAGAVRESDEIVLRVLDALVAASRPERTLGECLTAAEEAYAAAGRPDAWARHHQGGTIGYRPRERIAIPGDRTTLEPGMVLAWNPSLPGSKVEATVLVRASGDPEVILAAQRSA